MGQKGQKLKPSTGELPFFPICKGEQMGQKTKITICEWEEDGPNTRSLEPSIWIIRKHKWQHKYPQTKIESFISLRRKNNNDTPPKKSIGI